MDHINPVLGALALTAICAAAVSTANSMLLHCSTSLIYDIKRVLKGGEASEEEDAKTTKQLRVTILSLGVIAVICAIGQFSLLATASPTCTAPSAPCSSPPSGWASMSSA